MSALERAMAALASLEALAEERREAIALHVLALIEAHAGGVELSAEDLAALEADLQEEGRIATDEEVEAVFKTLLRD